MRRFDSYQVNTVQRWVSRFERDGNVQRIFSPGRPRITTNEQNTALAEYLRANPFSYATRAAALENIPYRTAARRIREQGLLNRIAAHETELSPEHKRLRILYCRSMLDVFREQNFPKIIFTDEKTFMSDKKNSSVRVYRQKGERYQQKYVKKDRLSGHISGGFWGWMGIGGPGELVEIGGHFNHVDYLEILDEVAIPSIERQYGSIDDIVYMHDNSRVHTARVVTEYLRSKHITVLEHPARSPDLNLIENLWSMMERDRPQLIQRTPEGLRDHVFNRWENLRDRLGIIVSEFSCA